MRQACARDEEDAFEVGVDEFVPVVVGGGFEGDAGGVYACAVEDVVDFTEFRDCRGDEGLHLGGVAYVDLLRVGWGGAF